MASRSHGAPPVRRAPDAAPRPAPGTGREVRPLHPATISGLQRSAGNVAVSAALTTALAVQRDDPKTDPVGKGQSGTTQDVIFILRKPGDEYTKGMAEYVRTTLKGQAFK